MMSKIEIQKEIDKLDNMIRKFPNSKRVDHWNMLKMRLNSKIEKKNYFSEW